MITLSRTVQSPRPVEVVAHYLSDFRTTEQWDPHTVNCERVDAGEIKVGAEYDNTQRMGLLRSTLRYRVQEYLPGEAIRLHSSGRMLEATDDMRFRPHGAGSEVTYTAHFAFKGPLRLAEPLLKPMLSRIADQGAKGMAENLQRLPEEPSSSSGT
ncbi:MAG: SRPBCC family protein [Sporichthyaceae bacterium]